VVFNDTKKITGVQRLTPIIPGTREATSNVCFDFDVPQNYDIVLMPLPQL
jgi:hypothetical protein